MNRIFQSILVILIFASSTALASEEETAYERIMKTNTIRCGYYLWPPYVNKDPNTGELSGVFIDVSNSIMKMLGLSVEYVELTLGYQMQDLKTGRIDAICGDAPLSLGTIKYIDYSRSYTSVPVYTYVNSDDSRFSTLEDLNSPEVKFVAIDGDLSLELARLIFPKARINTLPNTSDPAQMSMDVSSGKADAVINDPSTVGRFLEANPGTLRPASDEPLAIYPVSISVLKGENELKNTLDMATEMAINMNVIDRILDKYDPEHQIYLRSERLYKVKR